MRKFVIRRCANELLDIRPMDQIALKRPVCKSIQDHPIY